MAVNSKLNFDLFARDNASPVFNRFGKEVKRSERSTKGLASGVATLAKGFLAFAAVQKATDFVKESIKAGREQQKTEAQTEAVLKSTGHAAHVTGNEIERLSKKLSLKTGIDDDQITAGQNMLLTFRGIRNEAGKGNDIFTQATKIALDMGVALKKGPVASNLLLGKALNDPTKGMAKLTRAGVTFTDQQKKQVAAMQAAGDTAGAQKVILKELEKEYGGSAAAQATAADKFHNSFHLLQEQVGTALLPVLDKMAIAGTKAVAWLQKNPAAMKAILIGIAAIAAAFVIVIAAGAALEIAIGAVVGGLIYAYTKFKWFHDGVNAVALGIGRAFRFLWNNILQPVFKLITRAIAVQLIAWGVLISSMGHIPGFGWAKKLGDAMQTAGHKALDLADHINKIPKHHNTDMTMSGNALSGVAALKSLLSGIPNHKKVNVTVAGQYKPGHNAAGTQNWRGGLTTLNENGQELVDLPAGSKVYSHSKSKKMLENGGSGASAKDIATALASVLATATFRSDGNGGYRLKGAGA